MKAYFSIPIKIQHVKGQHYLCPFQVCHMPHEAVELDVWEKEKESATIPLDIKCPHLKVTKPFMNLPLAIEERLNILKRKCNLIRLLPFKERLRWTSRRQKYSYSTLVLLREKRQWFVSKSKLWKNTPFFNFIFTLLLLTATRPLRSCYHNKEVYAQGQPYVFENWLVS